MARNVYLYNPTTQLWYPLIAVGAEGDVAPAMDDSGGVLTPPAYVPTTEEPLVALEDYETITGTTVTNTAQWTWLALAVSQWIEHSCHYSWRTEAIAVPIGLQVICAKAIRAYTSYVSTATGKLQSESFTSYSYSLAAGQDLTSALAPIKPELALYTYHTIGC